jgi:FAD/FMN-containing dehydrogenase
MSPAPSPLAHLGLSLLLLLTGHPSHALCGGGGGRSEDTAALLNRTIGGALQKAEPVSRPCFSTYNGQAVTIDDAACAVVRANYSSNTFRADTGAAYMNMQSEVCLSDVTNQCILDTTTTPPSVPGGNATCRQGSVSDYFVEVDDAATASAVLAFADARPGAVRLRIKNSGHDYQTRNTVRGGNGALSVELWVHSLKGLTYHDAFTPAGCTGGVGRAVTVGAGESSSDAIAYAAAHDSILLSGYNPTIAVSGGWSQGGGHSVLSPVYGLGADRVAQFRVVTPDGVLRNASACENPDLFRALRGGGGGTFGVVVEATHMVAESVPIAVSYITIPSNSSDETVLEWIRLQASNSLRWGQEGWGGHVAGLYIKYFNPVPSIANVSNGSALAESMRVATEFALSVGGTSDVEIVADWETAWTKYVVPGATATAGAIRIVASQLLSASLFATDDSVQTIMDYLASVAELGFNPRILYIPVGSPFLSNYTVSLPQPEGSSSESNVNHGTSVHPSWYGSLWSIALGIELAWNSTYTQRLQGLTALTNATKQMEALGGPESGSYTNEANPWTQDWQQSWWGDNYDFLLATKQKYDPNSTLRCWKCVGYGDLYGDNSDYEFGCQGGLQADIDSIFS